MAENLKTMRLAFILLLPVFCSAQIEIKKTSRFTVGEIKATHTSLSGVVENEDTTYMLAYENMEYKTITDIQVVSFKGAATLNTLYETLKAVFVSKEDLDFKLGNTSVMVKVGKMIGVPYITFFGKSGFTYITEKQLDKLFGK